MRDDGNRRCATLQITYALTTEGGPGSGTAAPSRLRLADVAGDAPSLLFRFGPWALGGLAIGGALFALRGEAGGGGGGLALPGVGLATGLDAALADGPGFAVQTALVVAAILGFALSGLRRRRRLPAATLTLDATGYRLATPKGDRARNWALLDRVEENDGHLLLVDRLGGTVAVPKALVAPDRLEAVRRFAALATEAREAQGR